MNLTGEMVGLMQTNSRRLELGLPLSALPVVWLEQEVVDPRSLLLLLDGYGYPAKTMMQGAPHQEVLDSIEQDWGYLSTQKNNGGHEILLQRLAERCAATLDWLAERWENQSQPHWGPEIEGGEVQELLALISNLPRPDTLWQPLIRIFAVARVHTSLFDMVLRRTLTSALLVNQDGDDLFEEWMRVFHHPETAFLRCPRSDAVRGALASGVFADHRMAEPAVGEIIENTVWELEEAPDKNEKDKADYLAEMLLPIARFPRSVAHIETPETKRIRGSPLDVLIRSRYSVFANLARRSSATVPFWAIEAFDRTLPADLSAVKLAGSIDVLNMTLATESPEVRGRIIRSYFTHANRNIRLVGQLSVMVVLQSDYDSMQVAFSHTIGKRLSMTLRNTSFWHPTDPDQVGSVAYCFAVERASETPRAAFTVDQLLSVETENL